MKINFNEASTKRGIVMIITGCITLYNVTFGSGAGDIDALMQRIAFWIGTGITIAGMFGLLPDQPIRDSQERTRETDIPKEVYLTQFSLEGKSDAEECNSVSGAGGDSQYRSPSVIRARNAELKYHDEH